MGVFHHCDRMCSCLDGCAFFTSRLDVSAEPFFTDVSDVMSYHAGECECWPFLTSRSDVSVGRAFLTSRSYVSVGHAFLMSR